MAFVGGVEATLSSGERRKPAHHAGIEFAFPRMMAQTKLHLGSLTLPVEKAEKTRNCNLVHQNFHLFVSERDPRKKGYIPR